MSLIKSHKGFILIPVIIAVIIIASIGVTAYSVFNINKLNQSKPSFSEIHPIPQDVQNDISVTTLPTFTQAPSKPTPSPVIKKATPKPSVTTKPSATPAPTPTQPPVSSTPTPTPVSTEKPVLTITGPYTIGQSGPCFDLKSHHPYNYSQSADYKFDSNEQNYRYTTLRREGSYYVGTVCWEKNADRTGHQYVFKAKSYTDRTPQKIYSDEVSLSYTHP